MRGPAVTPRGIENLRRARALDDGEHDDVCPGCKGVIVGWQRRYGHLLGKRGQQVLFVDSGGPRLMCVWTMDYLSARSHRRKLIRAEVNQVEGDGHYALPV